MTDELKPGDEPDVDRVTGDERETMCQEWWKNPRVESSGETIIDHNHICVLKVKHEGLCQCKCGVWRPVEDYI